MFSLAFASDAAQSPQSSILSLMPIIVLVVVFYFFIIRPQQKKVKQENEMRNKLRVGDKIVTTSGIFGSIAQIDDAKNVISVEIAKNTSIVIYKTSIAEVLTQKQSNAENEKSIENK
jgi:preprotein translocase subunit YajC